MCGEGVEEVSRLFLCFLMHRALKPKPANFSVDLRAHWVLQRSRVEWYNELIAGSRV